MKSQALRYKISNFFTNITKPFFNINAKQYNIAINNKPLKDNSVMIWDIENIPLKAFNYFKKFIKYTPQNVFVVSKRKLSDKEINFFENLYFYYKVTNSIADDFIIKILKIKKLQNTHFTLISSDSDFAKICINLLNSQKYVHVISSNANNKRLLMYLPLDSQNLSINSFEYCTKSKHKKSQREKQENCNFNHSEKQIKYCSICSCSVIDNKTIDYIEKNKSYSKPICKDCGKNHSRKYNIATHNNLKLAKLEYESIDNEDYKDKLVNTIDLSLFLKR